MASKGMARELRKPDSNGRIIIGKEFVDETYSVEPQANGDILLRPVVVMPKQEAWLFQNLDALRMVKEGLRQSANGETHDLGSFTQYIEESDEDD